jgi:hypothetical protein
MRREREPERHEAWPSGTRVFRLVMIPEPSTALLVIAGLLGLAGWCRSTA